MVHIVRKSSLPGPAEVIEGVVPAAIAAHSVIVREPRPAGFPLMFTAQWQLIEPAVAFLHEHFVQRAHTADTLRTYSEILYDWFETLEQNAIPWDNVTAVDLVAYRNRMLQQPSAHTGRPYRITTINHRVRGVLRFYEWAVRTHWLSASPLTDTSRSMTVASPARSIAAGFVQAAERSFFVLRQFEPLPRPLVSEQARELLASLPPPYDLMARWQLYTGLRVSELLRLRLADITKHRHRVAPYETIPVIRKGRKSGHVIASASLLDETAGYVAGHRHAWLQRAGLRRRGAEHAALFINALSLIHI